MTFMAHTLGIGIALADGPPRWQHVIRTALARQTQGFTTDGAEPARSILLHPFEAALQALRHGATIVPESSGYKDGLFVEFERGIALRFTGTRLDVYLRNNGPLSVPWLVQQHLIASGRTFVHGAGLARDGEATLVLAFGGIGKTALVAHATRSPGVTLLGDDLVAVSTDGTASPYLRPFCLYAWHRELFPEWFVTHRVRFAAPTLPQRILRRTCRAAGIPPPFELEFVTAPPGEALAPDRIAQGPVPIRRLFVARRVRGLDRFLARPLEVPSHAVDFAAGVLAHEFHAFAKITANRAAQAGESLAGASSNLEKTLTRAFAGVTEFGKIWVPEHARAERTAEELTRLLFGKVSA